MSAPVASQALVQRRAGTPARVTLLDYSESVVKWHCERHQRKHRRSPFGSKLRSDPHAGSGVIIFVGYGRHTISPDSLDASGV
jgi:hypothetical protein